MGAMQGGGFEPPNPLREQILSLSRLTTSLSLHAKTRKLQVLKFCYSKIKNTASVFRLLSETNATDAAGLSSVFGMRTGVSLLLWPYSFSLIEKGI